jgi:hypothetical protein
MTKRGLWASALTGLCLLVLLVPGQASAFCRTSTCDPSDPVNGCVLDANGCMTGGTYLGWSSGCVSFGVQKDASPLRGVDFNAAVALVSASFVRWQSADCGGTRPSITVKANDQAISCDRPEYNQEEGNANVWMFRDTDWPYEGVDTTLALTTVTFNVKSGEIFDADVEVNSFNNALAINGSRVGADLASILTHEAGHFLGLSHSIEVGATMYATYHQHSSSLSTLHVDDIAGICAAYPPAAGRGQCSFAPRHGFSTLCSSDQRGCSLGAPARGSQTTTIAAAALFALAALRRRLGRAA